MIRVTIYPAHPGKPFTLAPIEQPIMLPNGWVNLHMGEGRTELIPPTVARITVDEGGANWCGAVATGPFAGQICTRPTGHGGAHTNGSGHLWHWAPEDGK